MQDEGQGHFSFAKWEKGNCEMRWWAGPDGKKHHGIKDQKMYSFKHSKLTYLLGSLAVLQLEYHCSISY